MTGTSSLKTRSYAEWYSTYRVEQYDRSELVHVSLYKVNNLQMLNIDMTARLFLQDMTRDVYIKNTYITNVCEFSQK